MYYFLKLFLDKHIDFTEKASQLIKGEKIMF